MHKYYKHKSLKIEVAINAECAIMVSLQDSDESFFIKKMTGASRDFIDRETKLRDFESSTEENFYQALKHAYGNIIDNPYL